MTANKPEKIQEITFFLVSSPFKHKSLAGTVMRLNGIATACVPLYWVSHTARANFHSTSALF